MKIFIDQFCLSNGGDESPRELVIDGEQSVQNAPRLRGASADAYARGNRLHTLTLAVRRGHASYAAAEEFLLQHATELPASGVLTFVYEQLDGANVTYRATASVVAANKGNQAGLTTVHRYTLVCGEIAVME